MYRADTAMSGRTGDVGIVADYSVFHTDGYRANSSADRKQLNSVITWDVKEGTRAKFILNFFDMPLAKDPAGLTQAQFDADPKQAGANTEKYRARKIVSQNQVGTVIEHRIDQDLSISGRIYMGDRTNLGYQTNPGNATGKWVALSRDFSGVGVQLKGQKDFGGDTGLDWVVGVDYDIAKEHRTAGLTDTAMEKVATPNRDEINQASNTDLFGQVNWTFAPSWTATAGVRVSNIELKSKDSYLTDNVDGSGRVPYKATSPVVGITWHTNEALNLYANIGKGFETPTLAEVAYIKNPTGATPIASFNTELLASSSIHKEIGTKWKIAKAAQLNMAYFLIDTDHEIVVLQNNSGTTAYQNASKTKRDGIELSLSNSWTEQLKSQISLTSMRVKYTEAFGTALVNNYLPGIPENQVFANLTWTQNPSTGKNFVPGTILSGSLISRSRIYADDANKFNAPQYSVINLSAQQRYKIGSLNTTVYAAVDNAADKKGIGSVIVNTTFDRYFEPALPRNYTLGVQASLPF
jgi:iron complex outermembrane receptor protein